MDEKVSDLNRILQILIKLKEIFEIDRYILHPTLGEKENEISCGISETESGTFFKSDLSLVFRLFMDFEKLESFTLKCHLYFQSGNTFDCLNTI